MRRRGLLACTHPGSPAADRLSLSPHLACVCRDIEERPRFLVGVQVDVTEHATATDAAPVGAQAANIVGQALQNMNWVGVDPWATFPSGLVEPKPHRRMDPAAAALKEAVQRDGKLRLRHFARVRQLGSGDVGMVDLVQLVGGEHRFALKSLEKREMLERNKVGWAGRLGAYGVAGSCVSPHTGWGVHARCRTGAWQHACCRGLLPRAPAGTSLRCRAAAGPHVPRRTRLQVGRVRTEESILSKVDHPFLATLYGTLQTGGWPPLWCGALSSTGGWCNRVKRWAAAGGCGGRLVCRANAPAGRSAAPEPAHPCCVLPPIHRCLFTHPLAPGAAADTHLHFLLEFCSGGELYALLNAQPK